MAKERKEKHFINKPIYEGGIAAMKQFIALNKIYPDTAQKAGIEGTVVLRYSINHKGIVTDAKVISGVGGGCDEEAIRLVKLLKFKVAKNRGVRATFHKDIKIHFRKPKAAATLPSSKVQYAYTVSPAKKRGD